MNEQPKTITVQEDQALRALTFLVCHIRPEWDAPGVHTKLIEARTSGRQLDSLAVAALRAARDHTIRTPAVIALDGQHWRDPQHDPTPTPPRYQWDNEEPGDAQRGLALVREAMRNARAAKTAEGVEV